MISRGLLADDPISIARQIKEIMKWDNEACKSLEQVISLQDKINSESPKPLIYKQGGMKKDNIFKIYYIKFVEKLILANMFLVEKYMKHIVKVKKLQDPSSMKKEFEKYFDDSLNKKEYDEDFKLSEIQKKFEILKSAMPDVSLQQFSKLTDLSDLNCKSNTSGIAEVKTAEVLNKKSTTKARNPIKRVSVKKV